MKRQSAAEAALNKQVKLIYSKMELINRAIAELEAKKDSHRELIIQLESEIDTLRSARVAASKRNTP